MPAPLVVAVVGPTAAGKSDLAVALSRRLGGEVVNVDAMQVYRGMDIGTAKITGPERHGVRHHLLDVLDITETATVAEFQELARAAIGDCIGRGVVPVLAGGSALYVRAILDDFVFPGTDPVVRARLEAELEQHGSGVLHQQLAAKDPKAAEQILPSNGRRIVRALEVIELTGGPYVATLPEHRYVYPGAVQLGLDVPRPVLDERIDRRVDRMFGAGFVAEVRGLLNKGLIEGKTANRALGYSQVIALLNGELDEAQARERTAQATRRFARRQDSWFRKDDRISWLPYDAPDLVEKAFQVLRRTAMAQGNRDGAGGVVELEGPGHHSGAVDARG
ncbi:tRNA (adenosine(37)-N6)-dimethylallyltransferase MiaA [Kribbella solani]|uniref:tRNA (adenosine(37)-N6)-dimethylallyltransferase MiaA n=1 Tax=Kribbella solani TaxID=236067 RepID=UPI0029AAFEBB|nr:tRNA (adenosine(37)-N6)-dimethylallyltransferase MiaA [Kribbella solani]MDX2969947.1 tRNA (adenosine(37)-N6)-dimethylallyltransferase MiaA [Kribbella solani]MDX3002191.1 tRNA (adenosine(37)-N6)-dimethylallyltransferase MiaA [Kribbella solani]